MRVLLTNNSLASRYGTELYVRDVAMELMRRGHHPVAYSMTLGEVADELRAATVPVIGSLELLGEEPDVIHGHHHYETLAAMLRFPKTPVIYYCHGWTPWEEAPLRFPRILRYVAVDEICRERLITEGAIPSQRIELILNFFDPKLFPPRAPLPASPRMALAFGNAFDPNADIPILRRACERHGIELHAVGTRPGNVQSHPGAVLARYDIVFCKARAAIEAMAVGTAVILCNNGRLGPMVTPRNFQSLRKVNFGLRTLSRQLDENLLSAEIERYDSTEAAMVSKLVREQCRVEPAVDQILSLYQQVIAEWREDPSFQSTEAGRFVAQYLEQTAPQHKSNSARNQDWIRRATAAERAFGDQEVRLRQMEQERIRWMNLAQIAERSLGREREMLESNNAALLDSVQQYNEQLARLQADLEAVRSSATWRWSQSVLQNRFVQFLFGRIIQAIAKRSHTASDAGSTVPARALSTSR